MTIDDTPDQSSSQAATSNSTSQDKSKSTTQTTTKNVSGSTSRHSRQSTKGPSISTNKSTTKKLSTKQRTKSTNPNTTFKGQPSKLTIPSTTGETTKTSDNNPTGKTTSQNQSIISTISQNVSCNSELYSSSSSFYPAGYSLSDQHKLEARRGTSDATSETSSFINLLKGNIGTGVLAMPLGFYYAGLWVGFISLPILGFICLHCMHLLLESNKELCRREHYEFLSLEETASVAFKTGPIALRRHAPLVSALSKMFLVITQIGFCCVYVGFVSENLFLLIECQTGGTGLSLPLYNTMLLVPLLIICSIRQLKSIAYLSVLSGICHAISLGIIFYYCTRGLDHHAETAAFGGWANLPLFFGTAMFTFEGIGLILPIENKMRDPSNFGTRYGVLTSATFMVIFLYVAMGYYGYITFGSAILGSITLNLPSGDLLSMAVQVLVSVAIFLSYPLQLYVPVHVILALVCKPSEDPLLEVAKDYVIRLLLVFLTFILATAIPDIGLFISLVGAISSSYLALILPPVVHIVTFWPRTGQYNLILVKAVAIIGLGLLGSITGSYTSLVAIVQSFSSDNNSTILAC